MAFLASSAEFPRNQEEGHEPEGQEEHVEDVSQCVVNEDGVDGVPEVLTGRRLYKIRKLRRKLDLDLLCFHVL